MPVEDLESDACNHADDVEQSEAVGAGAAVSSSPSGQAPSSTMYGGSFSSSGPVVQQSFSCDGGVFVRKRTDKTRKTSGELRYKQSLISKQETLERRGEK